MLATRKPGRATKHFLIGLANIEPVEGALSMFLMFSTVRYAVLGTKPAAYYYAEQTISISI